MIFVTVGTNEAPFCRLLRAVGDREGGETLVVQHGPSPVRPRGAECFAYLPYPTLVEYAQTARVVVCHAGVGSVLVAVRAGKRPIVMPRLRRHGEAIDDHQVEFAQRLHREGVVELLDRERRLGEMLAVGDFIADDSTANDLSADLMRYLRATIGARRAVSAGLRN